MSPIDANSYYNLNFSTMPNVSFSQLRGFYNASLANSIFTNQVQTQQQINANNFKSNMSNMMQMMMMMKMLDTMDGASSSSSVKSGKNASVTTNGIMTNYTVTNVVKDANGVITQVTLKDKETGAERLLQQIDDGTGATNRFTSLQKEGNGWVETNKRYVLNGSSFEERQKNLTKGEACDISLNGSMSTYTVVSKNDKTLKLKDANGKTITLKSTDGGNHYSYNDIQYEVRSGSLLVATGSDVGVWDGS